MSYEAWNVLLAKHFFNCGMAGRRVYLYTTADLIEEIGRPYKAGVPAFIASVKAGPYGITRGGACLKALHVTKGWRSRPAQSFPPYIAYLALFVHAAGLSGDFAPHAYYPRLRSLLGEEPTSGTYPHFDRMIDLWDDLERWSNEDKGGTLGVFTASISGGWIHVGLPIAQAMLNENERRSLPTVFARAGFDSIVPPTDLSLVSALLAYGHLSLRPRTIKVLDGRELGSDRTREALLDIVLEELQDWDGTVNDAVLSEGEGRVWGVLRLCCTLDPISGRAHFALRCSTAHDLPDGGLILTLDGHPDRFSCDESVTGWSSPIEREDGGILDASTLDWAGGARMREEDREWVLTLPGQPIRILTNGAPYGLPGLVEARQLAVDTSFYLIVGDDCRPLLEHWGASSCAGFRAVPVTAGLPAGWRLYQADGVHDDSLVRYIYPMLALPTALRVDLFGGLRVSRGSNQYFRFAPPRIVVRGANNEVAIYCNNLPLRPEPDGLYNVPDDLLGAPRLLVQAHRAGEEVGRRAFYLLDSFAWRGLPPARAFDVFGNPTAPDAAARASGAIVTGVAVPTTTFGILDGLRREREVALIGREPGQIVLWPREPLPTWETVWAVTTGKRAHATFRGSSLSTAEPIPMRGADRKHLAAWKDILWYHRKTVAPPKHKRLRGLWEWYVKEAGRVR